MGYEENSQKRTWISGDTVVKWVGVPGMAGSVEPNVGTQYTIVKMDPAVKDTVQLATGGAGEVVAGVLMNKPQHKGTPASVAYRGRVPVQAGAPLAYGDLVAAGADGQAVVTADPAAAIGTVVEAASAKGVIATIDLELGR